MSHNFIEAFERMEGFYAQDKPDRAKPEDVESLLRSQAYAGLTVQQAISKYAPPVENDTVNYVNLVCAWAACRPTDLLADVLAS